MKAFNLQWMENYDIINMCKYDKTVDTEVYLASELKKIM